MRAWIGLGRLLGEGHDSTPRSGVDAPRLVKTEPHRVVVFVFVQKNRQRSLVKCGSVSYFSWEKTSLQIGLLFFLCEKSHFSKTGNRRCLRRKF